MGYYFLHLNQLQKKLLVLFYFQECLEFLVCSRHRVHHQKLKSFYGPAQWGFYPRQIFHKYNPREAGYTAALQLAFRYYQFLILCCPAQV